MQPHSLYLHIPFCQKRCSYCDFNTFAGISHLIPDYVTALIQEIEGYRHIYDHKTEIHSIFFGGGTPSLLSETQFERLFDHIYQSFDVLPDAEISIEANPGTISLSYLQHLKKLGVNRLSFGVQTTHKRDFLLMGRIHDYFDAISAVKYARQAGFDNVNVDLIYGLPDQSLEEWKGTINHILQMGIEHISLYALGIEEHTPLFDWVQRGLVNDPDPDLAALMYETVCEMLEKSKFLHYEISNFAKKSLDRDYRCLHNLQYWRNQPYFGLGAGAHGYFAGDRTENFSQVSEYIQTFQSNLDNQRFPRFKAVFPISSEQEMQETMMVGLRLIQEGVGLRRFQNRFNQDLREVFSNEIKKLTNLGLIEIRPDRVVLSKKGYLLGNLVFQEFV